MKRFSLTLLNMLCVIFLLTSCSQAQTHLSSPLPPPKKTALPTPTSTVSQGQIYTDAKLGFQLTVPSGWQIQPQPGSQSSPGNAAVTFTVNESQTHSLLVLGVFQGPTMEAAFAARGTPTARIGPYPAFIADRSMSEGRAPCLVRIFLAGSDYVLADWCAPVVATDQTQFEQVLATYRPASSAFVSTKSAVLQPQTCADMQHLLGYTTLNWGKQLGTPTSAGWQQMMPGVFLCSNDGSSDWYLFQCTELANRVLSERWALPHIPGNAARYYDYYQAGVAYPGTIRTFPTGSYQLSADASQGKSTFRPVPGDLLIFQDVNNPRVGWTSGLTKSPGHIAVIVGVDATHVYIAQENYNDSQYFLALPLHKVANGYEITDLSGWNARIVRGWIHFTANGGPVTT